MKPYIKVFIEDINNRSDFHYEYNESKEEVTIFYNYQEIGQVTDKGLRLSFIPNTLYCVKMDRVELGLLDRLMDYLKY